MTTALDNESLAAKTVGDVVAGDWRTAEVFDRFGIDFCCGGRRSVLDACRSAGIDVHVVGRAIAEIHGAPAAADAAPSAVDRLVDHIEATHHTYVRSSLPRITANLAKLVQVHGARHPELAEVAATFEALGRELTEHMGKEERVLFPYLRTLATGDGVVASPFGTVENPIRMMEREHEDAGALLQEIRTLTAGYTVPADGCTTYHVTFQELAHFEQDLHRHVHLENNVLFPHAVELEAARR